MKFAPTTKPEESEARPVDLVVKLTDAIMMMKLNGQWGKYQEDFECEEDFSDFAEWLSDWFETNTEDILPTRINSKDEIPECVCALIKYIIDDEKLRTGFYYGTDQGWYPFTSYRVATFFDPETAKYARKTVLEILEVRGQTN